MAAAGAARGCNCLIAFGVLWVGMADLVTVAGDRLPGLENGSGPGGIAGISGATLDFPPDREPFGRELLRDLGDFDS